MKKTAGTRTRRSGAKPPPPMITEKQRRELLRRAATDPAAANARNKTLAAHPEFAKAAPERGV